MMTRVEMRYAMRCKMRSVGTWTGDSYDRLSDGGDIECLKYKGKGGKGARDVEIAIFGAGML